MESPTRAPPDTFGGLSDGDRVFDVGCGTASLTFTFPEIANVASVIGIDLTEPYVEFARARNADPRIIFQQADARAFPFEDNSFDRAFSMLVLQFIPDAARAVAEMRRVVRPGGTVTAAVWVLFGSLHPTRMMWNVAAVVDPSIERPLFRALSAPNEMANQWRELGLLDVEQTCLLIRMEYSGFDDYWLPLTSEGRWHNLSLAYLLRPVRRWPSMCRAPISPNLPDGHVPSQRRMGLSWAVPT